MKQSICSLLFRWYTKELFAFRRTRVVHITFWYFQNKNGDVFFYLPIYIFFVRNNFATRWHRSNINLSYENMGIRIKYWLVSWNLHDISIMITANADFLYKEKGIKENELIRRDYRLSRSDISEGSIMTSYGTNCTIVGSIVTRW